MRKKTFESWAQSLTLDEEKTAIYENVHDDEFDLALRKAYDVYKNG